MNDLLGGQVQMGVFDVPVLLPHIRALNSAELKEQYDKVSGVPMPSSPEEYAVFLVQEQKKWGAVVRAIGFKAE